LKENFVFFRLGLGIALEYPILGPHTTWSGYFFVDIYVYVCSSSRRAVSSNFPFWLPKHLEQIILENLAFPSQQLEKEDRDAARNAPRGYSILIVVDVSMP
jgi:hypothetical protein